MKLRGVLGFVLCIPFSIRPPSTPRSPQVRPPHRCIPSAQKSARHHGPRHAEVGRDGCAGPSPQRACQRSIPPAVEAWKHSSSSPEGRGAFADLGFCNTPFPAAATPPGRAGHSMGQLMQQGRQCNSCLAIQLIVIWRTIWACTSNDFPPTRLERQQIVASLLHRAQSPAAVRCNHSWQSGKRPH